MKLLISLLLILANTSFGFSPSLESLLRNGNNPEVSNNTVQLTLKVTKQNNSDSELTGKDAKISNLFKYQIFNEKEDYPRLVQLSYIEQSASLKNLFDIKITPFHKLSSFSNTKEKIEQRLFFSLISMLMLNNGKLFLDFLEENGYQVYRNKNLIYREKVKLLEQYKRYLVKTKNTDANSVEMENPLKPSDPEERTKVSEIMAHPFYKPDPSIKRNKNGDYFNWVYEQDNLKIVFNNNHKIEEISLKLKEGAIKVTLSRFILLGSSLQFPETIVMNDLEGNQYEIKPVGMKLYQDNSKKFYKRMENYKKAISDNKIDETSIPLIFSL